jgi:hypothetical protein
MSCELERKIKICSKAIRYEVLPALKWLRLGPMEGSFASCIKTSRSLVGFSRLEECELLKEDWNNSTVSRISDYRRGLDWWIDL